MLVNNAAMPKHKHIYDVAPDEAERVLRVNFLACVWTSLAAFPAMLRAGEGWIVKFRISHPNEVEGLMDAEAYAKHVAEEEAKH